MVDLEKARLRIPATAVKEIIQGAADLQIAMDDHRHVVEVKIGSRRILLSDTMRETLHALLRLLAKRALGDVLVMGRDAEMSTTEAAHALGVSRPYVVSLIERRILPAHLVGTHRRVKAADVQAYQQSFARYDKRMGPIVTLSASQGGYDLKFPPRNGARAGRSTASSTTSALTPGYAYVAEPGLHVVSPGNGEIKIIPVSVCHHVSTTGQRSPPMKW